MYTLESSSVEFRGYTFVLLNLRDGETPFVHGVNGDRKRREKEREREREISTTRIKRGGEKVRKELEDGAEGADVRNVEKLKVERGGQTALFSRGKDESEAQTEGARKKEER